MADFSTDALSSRTMSALPCSIGTSLALESVFKPMQAPYDPEREIPQHINLGEYDAFYVNLMTLYRNVIGALPKDGEDRVMAGDLSDTLEFEVDLIKRLVQEDTFGKTKVIFYASNYKNLASHHPHAKLRTPTTDKQRAYVRLMELTLKAYIQSQAKSDTIELYDLKIKPKQKNNALILTHYAYDLLAHTSFEKLDLLESHTGLVKPRVLWYTKLSNSKSLMRLPLNACTLQVFGDSQTFFALPIKLREQVLELADTYNWNPLVTKDRLIFSFNSMKDQFAASVLKTMLAEG